MILIKKLKAFKHNYNKIKNKNINIFYNINGKDLTDINKLMIIIFMWMDSIILITTNYFDENKEKKLYKGKISHNI